MLHKKLSFSSHQVFHVGLCKCFFKCCKRGRDVRSPQRAKELLVNPNECRIINPELEISPPQTSTPSSPPPQQLCLIFRGPTMGPGALPTSSQQRASSDPMEEARDKQGFSHISTAVCSSVLCVSLNAT